MCLTDRGPGPIAHMAAQDVLVKAMIWLLRHATKPTLTVRLRVFGSYTRQAASERAAKLAELPGSTSWLEATLEASLGVARRRQGMKNDFTVSTPVPLQRIACPTPIVHGSLDKVVPPAHAHYAHAHITGSGLSGCRGQLYADGRSRSVKCAAAVDHAIGYHAAGLNGERR